MAIRVAGIFAAIGLVWVAGSDWLLNLLVSDPALNAQLQTAKGWLFVLVATVAVYLLARQALAKREAVIAELEEGRAALQASEARLHEAVRSLTEERGRYLSLFEHAPEALLVTSDHQVRMANAAAVKLFGASSFEELEGLSEFELFHPNAHELIRTQVRAMREGARSTVAAEDLIVRLDGRFVPVELVAAPFEDGGKTCIHIMIRDVLRRKASERALVQLNRELEQRVTLRTAELAKARDDAQAAETAKSQFLSTMSHELRTPLNSIIGFSGILAREAVGPLNAEQKKYIGRVRDSSRHLLGLINNVLDMSRFESGDVQLDAQPFLVGDLLRRVADRYREEAALKGLEFCFEPSDKPLVALADERRTEQVLLNLLSNALSFTKAGSITLSFIDDDDRIRVAVTDTGPGISESDQAKLFRPFSRGGGAVAEARAGAGLGLAISSQFVKSMGGEIGCNSSPGLGSQFWFTLPRGRID